MLHACPLYEKSLCRLSIQGRTGLRAATGRATLGLSFRPGTAVDAPTMRRLIWHECMNPLGVVPERFTVAEDGAGRLLGFGQLEQKDGYLELRSMVVDPSARYWVTLAACLSACSSYVPLIEVLHAGGRAWAGHCWSDCCSRRAARTCC